MLRKNRFSYWAFISYSSKDRRTGEWLRKRLENYCIPADLRGHTLSDGTKLGKYLRPVFRDRDELSCNTNLGEKIEEALTDSRCLVVLCSPNSAQSDWVNKEITEFQKMGRGGNILALILNGIPNSGSKTTECFPLALRNQQEVIAGDLRPEGDGKDRGFFKIFAGIAEMDFDQVYKRHERAAQRVRRIWFMVAGILVVLFAGLASLASWQRNKAQASELRAIRNDVSSLVQLSKNETEKGDTYEALSLALEAFDKAEQASLNTDPAESQLYNSLWRHRELFRRIDMPKATGNFPIVWSDSKSGGIRIATKSESSNVKVFELDESLTLLSSYQESEEWAEIESTRELNRRPQNVKISWSADRSMISFHLPELDDLPSRTSTVPAADLPFEPGEAWTQLKKPSYGQERVVVVTAEDGFGMCVITKESIEVVASSEQLSSIDPSGEIVVICEPWLGSYYVSVFDPRHQITMPSSYNGMFIPSLYYSPKEDIVSYFPYQKTLRRVNQPILSARGTGVEIALLGGHKSAIHSMGFLSTGTRLWTLTEEGVLRLWSARVEVSPELVARHGGQIITTASDSIEGSLDRRLSLTEDEYSSLHKGGYSTIRLVPETDLILVLAKNMIWCYRDVDLKSPLWVSTTGSKILDAQVVPGKGCFATLHESGALRTWDIWEGKEISEISIEGVPGASTLGLIPGAIDSWFLVGKGKIFKLDRGSSEPQLVIDLEKSGFINSQDFDFRGDYVHFYSDLSEQDSRREGVVLSLSDWKVLVRIPVEVDLVYDHGLGIAYSNFAYSGDMPILKDLKTGEVIETIYPDQKYIEATGLAFQASLSHYPIGPLSRRTYFSINGGNADMMFPGEGVLYDFDKKRVIARNEGDPDEYRDGEGLPVFCTPGQLASYVRELLASSVLDQ
jgi:hypothetical protein